MCVLTEPGMCWLSSLQHIIYYCHMISRNGYVHMGYTIVMHKLFCAQPEMLTLLCVVGGGRADPKGQR